MKKKKRIVDNLDDSYGIESDENFYYIVGYTSNGIPYGVTWEEAYEEGLVENTENIDDLDDIPF